MAETPPKVPCVGRTKSGLPCHFPAIPGEALCKQHHPSHEARRRAAGAVRHPKLQLVPSPSLPGQQSVALPVQKSRTIAGCVERILAIVDEVEQGSLEPGQASVAIRGLQVVCERYEKEIERKRKEKPAQPVDSAASNENGKPAPPWMVPVQPEEGETRQ
jgi:hypothetical protein